jgi:hypothetical protein
MEPSAGAAGDGADEDRPAPPNYDRSHDEVSLDEFEQILGPGS